MWQQSGSSERKSGWKQKKKKKSFNPLRKGQIHYTSSTGKPFWKWILDLPNYLGRADHWFSAHERRPFRPCPWGSQLDCAMTPTAAPGVWSSSERSPAPVGDAAKPTVWTCHKSAGYHCYPLLSLRWSTSQLQPPPSGTSRCSVSSPEMFLPS